MHISLPSMSTLTSIKVPILASHLHSGRISLAARSHLNLIQVTIIASQLHLGANIPPSMFWGKVITSTHTASQLHQAPYIYISPPSKSSLTPVQILIVYHLHPGHVSSPTRSPLLHDRINSGPNWKPTGYKDVHQTCSCPTESISKFYYLTYIHVPFHLHAGP